MTKERASEFPANHNLHRTVKLVVTLSFALLLFTIGSKAQKAPSSPDSGQPASAATASPATAKNSCTECHKEMGDELAAPVSAMADDIHGKRGLSCANCHGGDPTADDPSQAMSPAKGFIARPKPAEVARFCGKCHSDAEFMKGFNPAQRVDQEAEYASSVHGKRTKQGDTKPATCISCHNHHGIREVKDANSPVYPLNVSQTCGRCHANADYMRSYGIATDQLQKYNQSVHAEALLKKQDLSAPTCNDCHGNHGAAPPGIASVSNVCGTCHARQADLFEKSPHKAPFAAAQMAGCVVCHNNHQILLPSDQMLGSDEKAVCSSCHSEDAGAAGAQKMRAKIVELDHHINQTDQLLNRAAIAGMEVSRPIFDLKEARDKLINARVVVHNFSPEAIETAVNQGLEISGKANQAGQDALSELQFRRKGLGASLLVIFLAVAAIYLKIRQIERRSSSE
jgi:predicted CXXCH cytochrome family protein